MTTHITVLLNGYPTDFEACVNLMDDELRDTVHAEDIDDPQEFIDRYVELHAAKYADTFEV